MTVAVLFARRDSVYKTLPDVDVWDEDRDALKWTGGYPVVAHPPCRLWASLRHKSKADPSEKDLARFAVKVVRRDGGVLEHPQQSTLWLESGIQWRKSYGDFLVDCYDLWGGWYLPLHQHWFGHRAAKPTGLYIVGIRRNDIPAMPLRLDEPTHTIGLWSGRDKANCRPSVSKREFDSKPLAFALWLVEVAKRCSPPSSPKP